MSSSNLDVALRGLGPRVFLSYSYQDQELAAKLAEYLTTNGFQVRMEDETSLVGRRLESELARRIGSAECVIQLYTEAASTSHWVRQELAFAEAAKADKEKAEVKLSYAGSDLTIVPVALCRRDAAAVFGDLAFIDAANEGLSPTALEAIKKVCLSSVRIVEIDEENPHEVRIDDIERHLESSNLKKRVIFDGKGYWLRAIDGLISYAESASPDDRRARQFIVREMEHRRDIKWMLEIVDVAVESLFTCLNRQASEGFVTPDEFSSALRLFYKIPFFMHLVEILTMARSADTIKLGPEASGVVDELNGMGNLMLQDVQDKAMCWAFGQVLDGTDLSDYSPSRRPLIKLDMRLSAVKRMLAKSSYPCHIRFPKLVVPYMLGTEVLPNPRTKQWAWSLFGLPQAAAIGIEVGAPYRQDDRDVMYSAVNQGVGWFLDHYESVTSMEG